MQESEKQRKSHGVRHEKIILEEMLLITLEYITYFHIATNYNVSASYAYKIIRWVENTLIKGHYSHFLYQSISKSDVEYEVVLADASESPIQRPKKNNAATIHVRKKDIL